jgi:hypothetical protein
VATTPREISRGRPCQVLSDGVQDGPLVLPVVIARGQLGRGETVLWTGPSALSSDQPLHRTKPCRNHRPEMTTGVTIRVVKKLALRMPASKAPLASTIPGPARALQVTAISGGLLLRRGVSQMIQYGQTLERGGQAVNVANPAQSRRPAPAWVGPTEVALAVRETPLERWAYQAALVVVVGLVRCWGVAG